MKKARDFVKGLAKDKPPFHGLHCVWEEAMLKRPFETMGTTKAVGKLDGLRAHFGKTTARNCFPSSRS